MNNDSTRPMQFGVRDLLWWMAMAAFICGAVTVPTYNSGAPWLSPLGVAVVLSLAAWRLRHYFRATRDAD